MKKQLVFPVVSLLFLLAACGVPTAKFEQTVADLNACSKARDEAVMKSGACSSQLSRLGAEHEALKAERDGVQRERDDLKTRSAELSVRAEKAAELEKATATYQDLQKKLEKEIQEGKIQITEMKNRLTMTMVDKILFPSGSAEVSKDGKLVLDKVISILKDVKDKRIQVEGHTDNVRILSAIKAKYPTNWELSTARATQVVRYLQETGGLDPKNLSATGYAEYQPVAPNDTDEGKARNRRIEIVLLPLLN